MKYGACCTLRLLICLLAPQTLLVVGGLWTNSFAATSGAAGGTGGTPFTLSCPFRMVLIGIKGRSGTYIDQLRGICSAYSTALTRILSPSDTSQAGGTGGGLFQVICPSQTVLVGIAGKAGSVIDRLSIVCARISSTGRMSSTPEPPIPNPAIGTSGGGQNYSRICPDRTIARTLVGRAGNLIDRLELQCERADLAATRPMSVDVFQKNIESGKSVHGRVVLDGYPAVVPAGITLTASGADGVQVPPVIRITERSASFAEFTVTSTPSAVGCVTITASFNGATTSGGATFTPPTPPTNQLQFRLIAVNLLTHLGVVTFGTDGLQLLPASSNGTVSFTSDRPGATVAPSASYSANDRLVTVPIFRQQRECTVITATVGGVSLRRVLND